MRGIFALVSCVWLFSIPSSAQELPDATELTATIAGAIPSYWTLGETRILSDRLSGDPAKPGRVLRFEALATSAAEMFIPTGEKVGPYVVVVAAAAATTRRKLHGTISLTFAEGAWDGTVVIDNPPDRLGMPLDFYTEPTLALGSDEFEPALTALYGNRLIAETARIAAETQQVVADKTARRARALQELDQTHSGALADMAALHAERLARIAAENAAELDGLRKSHAVELDELARAHSEARASMTAENLAQTTQLEADYAARKEAVSRLTALAGEILQEQSALIALRETILDNDAYLAALADEVDAAATGLADRMLGTWNGHALCGGEGDGGAAYTFVTSFDAADAGSLKGTLRLTGGSPRITDAAALAGEPVSATLSLLTGAGEDPVRALLVTPAGSGRDLGDLNFTMILEEDGTMAGSNSGAGDCKIAMAR